MGHECLDFVLEYAPNAEGAAPWILPFIPTTGGLCKPRKAMFVCLWGISCAGTLMWMGENVDSQLPDVDCD